MSIHPNYSTSYHRTFFIDGMTCASCVERIEHALSEIEAVSSVVVHLSQKKATVYSHVPLNLDDLMEIVAELGFQPSPPQNLKLTIQGMSCAACVSKVEKKLLQLKGVTAVFIHPTHHHARVEAYYQVEKQQILDCIQSLGYQAEWIEDNYNPEQVLSRQQYELQLLKSETIVACVLALPVVLLEMSGHFFPAWYQQLLTDLGQFDLGQQDLFIFQWALTTAILLFSGWRFIKQGIPALFRLAPDMNTLVAIGMLSAYGYSLVATFAPTWLPQGTVFVYYEATVVIISLILLGRYIESKAKHKASSSIDHLLDLQVNIAHVFQQHHWVDVPVDDIQVGDVIEVRAGERIPVDGVVVDGESDVDESMLTGESIPTVKRAKDKVFAGTLNHQGLLHIKATHTTQQSTLAQMLTLVEEAQNSKLAIQQVIDKITLYFVPAILALAGLTFLAWWIFAPHLGVHFALVNAVAVLIVACPCAMGLATPISIMLGLNRGVQHGILFRHSEALQQLQQCQTIVFDKTGTLTEGKPTLTDFKLLNSDFDEQDAFQWLASIEAKSSHPIAQAIVKASQDLNLKLHHVDIVEDVVGHGVVAYIQDVRIAIGAERYMQQLQLDTQPYAEQVDIWSSEGKTVFFMATQQQIIAMLAVADKIKPETALTIQKLKQRGLRVAMLTGDHQHTAEYIAKQIGIEQVIANVMPQDKLQYIQELQQQQQKVAFVGDGINDAPALAQADVGIAVGTGTDIAIESADVIVMSGRLTAIVEAIVLSRATIQNIYQNLFWAFVYNLSFIPIAMGVFYVSLGWLMSPMLSALAMACSSIFVVFNALRLRKKRLS